VSHLRGFLRLAGLAIWTTLLFTVLVVGRRLCAILRTSPTRLKSRLMQIWSRGVCALLGIRVTVQGSPPSPPFLLVANHLSYVDIVILASRAEGVFVARGDLSGWPILGRLSRSVDTLYVDRQNRRDLPRIGSSMETMLREGRGVYLFPEGTSTGGETILPFKPAILDLAARNAIPVWHAAISYTTPPGATSASQAVCWWGDMTFFKHLVNLTRLPGFEARLSFGDAPLQSRDRKALAAGLWREVRRRFIPVTA
jgi:1-acyl-sn-glycerol-3-phosphate acyltransferase